MTLKQGIGTTGVELRFYPRKEYASLSTEQKDELREFSKSAAGKKQKAATKAQGGGHPTKKQKTNNNSNNPSLSTKQVTKIAAAVAKLGEKTTKETSKFDKGMEKISALLVNSTTLAQVGGVGGEVAPSAVVDKRKEKMAEVAVVLKSFMGKRGKQSKKNNRDSDLE